MRYMKMVLFMALAFMIGSTVLTACKKTAPEMMTPTAIVTELSEQKDQYVRDLQATIDDYQAKIDDLREQAKTMSGTARDELNQKIDLLTAKQEEARSKIEEIRAATEEMWEKAKAGSDLILSDLEKLYNDTLSLVK